MSDTILLTGFEPFGQWRVNPSGELARSLDGAGVAGATVVGRVLPVRLAGIREHLAGLVDELRPLVVVGTGLAPGAAVVRLERFAVNLADFRMPDNDGEIARDVRLAPDGPAALASRLPLRETADALLAAGIPAQLSNSAGTYLCNAVMHAILDVCGPDVPAGFVHVPNVPEQVAATLLEHKDDDRQPGQAELSSMSLPTMRQALWIVLSTAVAAALVSRTSL
jgi:pyroglutamyl-peptidase